MTRAFGFRTKVVGVTFDDRQKIIAKLALLDKDDTALILEREKTNAYDSNAIKVIARTNESTNQVGYLGKDIAATVAPFIDQGRCVSAKLENISGGGNYTYGMNIAVTVS